ncbi:hypothetical protein CIN_04420 [Commensalibacter intestini A911]|uniref:Endonuclease n=1 Tax=Commensalibacter intestini A911 TaxID=1088868 RepID=G6EYC2_9PROT|nr:DNA/RNA non-specific endonuclease [Commensalibacter intestini]EHD14510.1 hypothetical protein CIN_04420 [Commensalibacter intestini A911]
MKKIYTIAILGLLVAIQAKAEGTCVHEVPMTSGHGATVTDTAPTPLSSQADIKNCDRGYAWAFSNKTNVNVYSAEYLTRDQVQRAKEMRRYGSFDNRDPLIKDYRNSGYDRGHMTPSGDMGDYDSQVKTFIPQNLVPQTKQLNSGKWNWIESQVRQMAIQYGAVYVVTGPYFQGRTKKVGEDRLWVPYATWKAVYIPELKQSGVYFCRNIKRPTCYIQTVAFFTEHTGIDPFPALASSIKETQAPLPKMLAHKKKKKRATKQQMGYNW